MGPVGDSLLLTVLAPRLSLPGSSNFSCLAKSCLLCSVPPERHLWFQVMTFHTFVFLLSTHLVEIFFCFSVLFVPWISSPCFSLVKYMELQGECDRMHIFVNIVQQQNPAAGLLMSPGSFKDSDARE